jgi:gliding motility-associated-like protein
MKKYLFILIALLPIVIYSQSYTIDQGGSIATCSASLFDSGGNSGNYGNNENEVITFCSNNSTCVQVSFNSFNLDTSDYLYIYNGPNTASQLLAVLTGNNLPPSYSSFYGCLTFQFVSNDTITSSGFSATISCGTCTYSGGGSGTLSPIYDNEACGLNYTQVSKKVTTRYTSPPSSGLPTTLNVTGLPPANTCWSLEKAILYWTESSNSNGNVSVTLTNPNSTTFSYNVPPVGVGVDKCWGTTYTTNYRIDVTSAISGNGNYNLNISSGSWNVDGVTLIIIYRDLNATYTGRLLMSDGALVSSSGSPTYIALSNINACANSTYANAFLMVGDMQDNINPTHNSTLNGTTQSFPNNFWNFDQINTTVTAGQATSSFGADGGGSDCYSVVGVGLYYQTNCLSCPSNAFSVPITQTIQTCSGGDIVANPGGGAPPFTYQWNTGDTSKTLTGLGPGTYTVTVTDNIGCQASNSITITAPPPLSVTGNAIDATCNGINNGSISVNVSGGTPPYNYSWNNGSTSNSISGLSPGTYIVTISDSLNCTISDTFTVNTPQAINISFNGYNISCFGGNDGSIQAIVNGGTPPYNYSWSNGQTTDSISNLTAGTYILTVTDNNNCSSVDSITLTEPTQLSASITVSNLLCYNDNSGSAIVNISGGTGPYNIMWNTGSTSVNLNGLSAGLYYVNITDNNGCTTSDTITLTQPTILNDTFSVSNVLCNGDASGYIQLYPIGGTPPYTFSWNNGSTSQNLSGLVAGSYIVTITDNNGCTKSDTITIIEPAPISTSYSTSPTCKDSCFGQIQLSYTGGVSPYQVIWETGDTNVNFIDSLCEGNYNFLLTDANGCSVFDSVSIGLLSQINAYFVFSPDSEFAPVQVSFTDSSTGTIIGWLWDFGNNTTSTSQNPNVTYNEDGTYTVTLIVKDSLGCADSYTVELTVLPPTTIIIPNVFTPNNDGVNDIFTIKSSFIKKVNGLIYNRWGQLLYEWHNANGYWDGRTSAGKEVPEGTYYYIIKYTTLKNEDFEVKGSITLIR